MKKRGFFIIKAFILVITFMLINNNLSATETESEKVIDTDIVLQAGSGSGTLVITDKGNLYVTGQEQNGEFGDGDSRTNAYTEFTKIDISHLDSKPIDISSSIMGTTILTQNGSVYRTGSFNGSDNSGDDFTKFTKIDSTLFNNKKVKSVYRTIHYQVYQTEDNKLYISGFYLDGKFHVYEIPLPSQANGIKKVSMYYGGGIIYLLDNSGKVWFTNDIYELFQDSQFLLNWSQVLTTDGSEVFVKDLMVIFSHYFLLDDGRVMFNGSYENLDGTYADYIDYDAMGPTDITDVKSFVPFYAPTIHSYYPNVKKNDGKIYVGREILENFGVSLTETDRMVATTPYLPNSNNASLFTIHIPESWYGTTSAGAYVVNGLMSLVNSDQFASNGLLDPQNRPEFALNEHLFNPTIKVVNPQTPIFNKAINPTSVKLPPKQVNIIPVQANWKIVNEKGVVVKFGVDTETNAIATLDISKMKLSNGKYTLSFFRETTPEYTGTYIRSATTAKNSFEIDNTNLVLSAKSKIKYMKNSKVSDETFLKDINASTNKKASIKSDFNKVVNLNKVGDYKVTVVAVDQLGKKVTKIVIVTIYDESDLPQSGSNSIVPVALMSLLSIISLTVIYKQRREYK